MPRDRTIKRKEQAIEHFDDKDVRETFFTFFKQVQNLYNILSPDAFLQPFIEDYQALVSLYGLIRNAFSTHIYVHRELTTKTRELLQDQTEGDLFALPNAIYELNETTLRRISQSNASDTVKVLNLVKAVSQTVTDEAESKPFLRSIGDRAEAAIQNLEDRQLGTKDALTEFLKLAESISRAEREQHQMELDDNSFAVYTVMSDAIETVTPEQARSVNQVFEQFPDYQWDEHQQQELRRTLYSTLAPSVDIQTKIEITNKLLMLQRL